MFETEVLFYILIRFPFYEVCILVQWTIFEKHYNVQCKIELLASQEGLCSMELVS
jgi:hypothetical protein